MAALPPRPQRRRLRPGSLERPVNARTYRGTWLLVGIPLLIAAFSVRTPQPLPRPALPPAFDVDAAVALAGDLARSHPDRRPGADGGALAATWFSSRMRALGFRVDVESFVADVPDRGRVRLRNLLAVVPGQSPETIVVMAHRDNTGEGPGANDNASGTAALIELARSYANPAAACTTSSRARRACPAHTIVFLSTDAGAHGALGAEHFVASPAGRSRLRAVVNLDAVAGRRPPRLQLAGERPRSSSRTLVETAAQRVLEQAGRRPARPSALHQLIDLAFPFNAYEHAPMVARGIPAVTLTTAPDHPQSSLTDTPEALSARRFGELGRAAQELVGSLDQGLELATGTSPYLYFGPRLVPGWAVELVLVGALLPFLVGAVDLFARCRRRRIALLPAWRSYRSRLAFWLFSGAALAAFALVGLWPDTHGDPPPLGSDAAGDWPVRVLLGLGAVMAIGWLLARERLLPRRPATQEEQLAGYTVGLLALAIASLLVVAANPFALLFVLPSLHAWLWLPVLRSRSFALRGGVLAAGFLGPALLVFSFAERFELGFDAPWYLLGLVTIGYVPLPLFAVFLAWLAVASQLTTLAAGRYAPYPSARERPPRGPLREATRRLVLAVRRGGDRPERDVQAMP